MRAIPDYSDERLKHHCVFCGGAPDTRDHSPSRVLLDHPFPDNLPVVQACTGCNASYSADEEYLACLVECASCGTTDPSLLARSVVSRILTDRPALRARLENARQKDASVPTFTVEVARVANALSKLAIGHAAFEMAIYPDGQKPRCSFWPLADLEASARNAFENIPAADLFPEVGSRMLVSTFDGTSAWQVVQEGRYRYATFLSDGVRVRIVLSEYLACEVSWS